MSTIEVPPVVRDGSALVVASVSGGKDSTALMLALREADVPFRAVFADTGWEAPETYAHLDDLRRVIGPIDVCGAEGGMVAKIKARAGFPARMQRWCTRELKINPLRAYHDAIDGETVSAVGVRAEESDTRARMAVFADEDMWGGYVWRPLLAWSVEEVLAIHHRHGVAVNPLYLRGHDRVGCYPCVYSRKDEIRLIAEHAPGRIAEIDALEREAELLRAQRNAETPGRYAYSVATFFQAREVARRTTDGDAEYDPMPIAKIVEWSKSVRGGKQLPLIQPEPEGGCFRWGMCEPPVKDGDK